MGVRGLRSLSCALAALPLLAQSAAGAPTWTLVGAPVGACATLAQAVYADSLGAQWGLIAIRAAYTAGSAGDSRLRGVPVVGRPTTAGTLLAIAAYGTTYGVATRVGSRLGLSGDFKVVRLETAYFYDCVGHAFVVRGLGEALTSVTRAAGYPYAASRTAGVWWGAFGSELYMEAINGFMPGVRFDPLDPVSNFVGAWLATGGRDLAGRHPALSRLSFEFGYRSWARAVGPAQDSATLGNLWHDHPNGRFGLGYAIGPDRRPWISVVATYEITSLKLAELHNRFGIGVELHPLEWAAPALERWGAGRMALHAYRWLDSRVLLPGLYIQLAHVDAGPFSDREPFDE